MFNCWFPNKQHIWAAWQVGCLLNMLLHGGCHDNGINQFSNTIQTTPPTPKSQPSHYASTRSFFISCLSCSQSNNISVTMYMLLLLGPQTVRCQSENTSDLVINVWPVRRSNSLWCDSWGAGNLTLGAAEPHNSLLQTSVTPVLWDLARGPANRVEYSLSR